MHQRNPGQVARIDLIRQRAGQEPPPPPETAAEEPSRRWAIGVDPGLTGGIALLSSDKRFPGRVHVPQWERPKKSDLPILDDRALSLWLAEVDFSESLPIVFFERVGPAPREAAKASFTFGWATCFLYSFFTYAGLEVRWVPASRWQKVIEVEADSLAKTPQGMKWIAALEKSKAKTQKGHHRPLSRSRPKPLVKEAARQTATKEYPRLNLLATARSRVPHSGLSDAVCIAHYGLGQLAESEGQ